QHLVERGPLDVERARARDEPTVEVEARGVEVVAHAEFGAVLLEMWHALQRRFEAQLLHKREIPRQNRLADVKAREFRFLQRDHTEVLSRQEKGGSRSSRPGADDDHVAIAHESHISDCKSQISDFRFQMWTNPQFLRSQPATPRGTNRPGAFRSTATA